MECFTSNEEEGGNLMASDGHLVLENWEYCNTVVTNTSCMIFSIIKTLGFDSITSGKDRATEKRISEDLMRYEVGKASEVGLQLDKELTGVDLREKLSTISRPDEIS